MDPGCDLVEKLLETTGLSCDDLLQKLQQYRSIKTKYPEETTKSNLEQLTNHEEKQCNDGNDKDSAISKKETNVDCSKNVNSHTMTASDCESTNKEEKHNFNEKLNDTYHEELTGSVNDENEEARIDSETVTTNASESISKKRPEDVDTNTEKVEAKTEEKKMPDETAPVTEDKNACDKTTKVESNKESEDVEDTLKDHTYSTSTELPQTTPTSEEPQNTEELPKSEDSIRDSLRMQLSSLRNMKKSNEYLPELKTTALFFHNLKKKRKSCDVNTSNDSEKGDKEMLNSNENSLVSLSDETDFLIVDVSGGVDRLTPEVTSKEDDALNVYKKKKLAVTPFDSSITQEAPNVSVRNISESFNRDPGINRSVKNNEKSPFVSDSLEDFLNESAELRISYPIPKLRAEEGIGESTKTSPFDHVVAKTYKTEHEVVQKEKQKVVKAKTLAEMRRQFEKLKAKEQGAVEGPRTKKKLGENQAQAVTLPRNSFIIFNNKKLWLTSRHNDRCLGVVRSSKQEDTEEVAPRKPSLLSSLSQNRSWKITYRPGPLSKKASLQNIDSKSHWTTEVKTLPKIYLEVTPEAHKPINPALLHFLPTFDNPVITEERVKFALSVLQPKDTNTRESFTFLVPYRNKQEQMVVRKPYKPPVDSVKTLNDPQTDISNILNDLLTYVETKEIADSLIKDDVFEETPVATPEVSPKGKKKVKRKKLDLELRRLNCKVIDVATNDDDVNCSKPHCKLGCVCKSLQCESVFSNHCRLVGCMFGCKCPPEKLKKSLSIHTVNHLEIKAKKNLARIEKEFTQTLIHTDDDAILVGTAKMRRSSKPPKKYTDYIGNDFFENNDFRISEEEISRAKRSHVVVEKLDLEGVMPLCLYHHTYSCSCQGEPLPKLRLVKRKDEKTKACLDSCARIRKVFSQYKERNKSPIYNQKLRRNLGYPRSESAPAVSSAEPKKPNKRKQSFTIRQDTSPVFSTEKEFALQRRKKKAKNVDTYSPVFEGEIKLSLQENKDMLKIIGTENASLEYLRILPWSKLVSSYQSGAINIWTKLKKTAILFCNTAEHPPPKDFTDIKDTVHKADIIKWILTDTLPSGMNRELMHLILTPKSGHFLIAGYCLKKIKETPVDPLRLSPDSGRRFEEIFVDSPEVAEMHDSDIEVDDANNQELIDNLVENKAKKLKMIGRNRIKLGTKFDRLYQGNSNTQDDPLEKRHSSSAMDTDKTKESAVSPAAAKRRKYSDLIKKLNDPLLITEKENGFKDGGLKKFVDLLDDKSSSEDHAKTLKEDNKKQKEGNRKSLLPRDPLEILPSEVKNDPVDPLDLSELLNESSDKGPPEEDPLELAQVRDIITRKVFPPSKAKQTPGRSLKCTHKDMENKSKILVLTTKVFINRILYCNNSKDNEISVPLPQVTKNMRWRMIYLNSDFTYLTFHKASYSIKYTDLMDVVKMASNIKSTITLRNNVFNDNFKHPLFGIFCVPDYQDRLFIGPYLPTESHDIETLRYLQGRLINTFTFNRMVCKKVGEKEPLWLYEVNTRPISFPRGLVIDITDDDDVVESYSNEEINATDHLLASPFVEILTAEELKAKRNINRYIMTNIPHLGYFEACQRDSRAIEVYWPNGTKGYRFPNVTFAKNLMTQYLSQIFCPIPQDLKISVIIMTNLEVQSNQPIDTKYFSQPGPFFCGEFGIYEKDTLPEHLLKKCNIPSVDSLIKAHKENQENQDAMIRIFGLFLMSNEELRKHAKPEEILKWALSEIYILKKLSDNYESEKTDLQNMIRANAQKIKKQRVILRNKSASETIEIKDSDEEDNNEVQKQPVFRKISTSGRIDTDGVFSSNSRSLLKPSVVIKPGHSLLKTNDRRLSLEATEKSPVKTVKLLSSVVVKDKLLVSKIK